MEIWVGCIRGVVPSTIGLATGGPTKGPVQLRDEVLVRAAVVALGVPRGVVESIEDAGHTVGAPFDELEGALVVAPADLTPLDALLGVLGLRGHARWIREGGVKTIWGVEGGWKEGGRRREGEKVGEGRRGRTCSSSKM